uniref:hypothetical protein n=1 Tax=Streptosporangium sp. CA-256172 TaxID=3240076 RepID=UPI003F495B19
MTNGGFETGPASAWVLSATASISSAAPVTVRGVDTFETSAEDDPEDDRALAKQYYQGAVHTFGGIGYDSLTAAEMDARTRVERLADAQLSMLHAMYHELRHGHNQTAAQTAMLVEHSKALSEHADAMDKLRGALLEHADALSRYRPRG